MIVAYAFIGPLPSYSIDTIHQMRLFYDDEIYFIISDLNSPHLETLKNKYDVKVINYNELIHDEFNKIVNSNYKKFCIVNRLKGREKLFIYSFERFFILYNLMKSYNLENVFFLELDNLIYDDPRTWEKSFQLKEIAYMYDNHNKCSSGICYIKNCDILLKFLNNCLELLKNLMSLWQR